MYGSNLIKQGPLIQHTPDRFTELSIVFYLELKEQTSPVFRALTVASKYSTTPQDSDTVAINTKYSTFILSTPSHQENSTSVEHIEKVEIDRNPRHTEARKRQTR